MMRFATPCVVLSLLLTLVLASSPDALGSSAVPPVVSSPAASRDVPTETSSEFLLAPDDGSWLRFSPPFVLIQFLNDTLGFVPEGSAVRLDGAEQPFAWSDTTRTVEIVLEARLEDGIHYVGAVLSLEGGSSSELSWTFGLDTQVPDLEIDPLPSATENRSLVVRGRASDAWLDGVMVLGRPVTLEGGAFSSTLLLWPGLNDIVIEARDLAGNLGRQMATVELQVPQFEGEMVSWVMDGAAFSIDVPQDWAAQDSIRLPSGNRADLVALAPLQPGLQTELVIASESTTRLYSEATAIDWMNLVLAAVEASGELKQVVSTPRLLDIPGTVAVQSTFLRETASERVAFMEITAVWSSTLRRQWVLLASTDERRAIETWPALSASVASFRVLDEGAEGNDLSDSVYVFPTALVMGAIAALLAIAVVALLPTCVARRKKREEGRWRPPRDWGL